MTNTVFDLPCVYSVHKEPVKDSGSRLCYLLYDWDEQGQNLRAYPTDWLCEDYDGRWHLLTDKDYQATINNK